MGKINKEMPKTKQRVNNKTDCLLYLFTKYVRKNEIINEPISDNIRYHNNSSIVNTPNNKV